MSIVLCVLFCIVYFLWKLKSGHTKTQTPPGPKPLPFLGNLHQVIYRCLFTADVLLFREYCQKYGNLVKLKLGSCNLVIVDSPQLVKEVLMRSETSGRRVDVSFKDRNFGKNIGLILSYGAKQQEMRKFILQVFKRNGFTERRSTENLINFETEKLCQHILKLMSNSHPKGNIHFAPDFFMMFAINLVSHFVTGERYDYEENEESFGQRFKIASQKYTKSIGAGYGIYNLFPILTEICPRLCRYTKLANSIKGVHNLAREVLNDINNNNNKEIDNGTFLNEFLNRMENPGNDFPLLDFNVEEFIVTYLDVMQAGVDPLTINLGFALYFLASNENVQQRLRNEINSVVGIERQPSVTDEERMPFARAVILEVLRCAKTLSFIPRSAEQDFEINGFLIKKESTILCSNYSISMDPKLWNEPEKFRPQRFLMKTNNGLSIDKLKSDRIMIFGAGKRGCFGEGLGRDALFLVLVTLVQKFSFKIPTEKTNTSNSPGYSYTFNPPPHDCLVETCI